MVLAWPSPSNERTGAGPPSSWTWIRCRQRSSSPSQTRREERERGASTSMDGPRKDTHACPGGPERSQARREDDTVGGYDRAPLRPPSSRDVAWYERLLDDGAYAGRSRARRLLGGSTWRRIHAGRGRCLHPRRSRTSRCVPAGSAVVRAGSDRSATRRTNLSSLEDEPRRRRGLAVLVVSPAFDRTVGLDAALMRAPRADDPKGTGGSRGLALRVVSPRTKDRSRPPSP